MHWRPCGPTVRGAGNLERFDYWLDTFRYMRANAQVNCTWHRFNEALQKVKAEKDPAAQQAVGPRTGVADPQANWWRRWAKCTATC